jgi:hypothetical protein
MTYSFQGSFALFALSDNSFNYNLNPVLPPDIPAEFTVAIVFLEALSRPRIARGLANLFQLAIRKFSGRMPSVFRLVPDILRRSQFFVTREEICGLSG